MIANRLSIFVDVVFNGPGLYSSSTLWLAVIAYSIQIYCDFSGYSDMAIGVARMLGYDLVKNFDLPYISTSVTEFWRRWHLSLSRWIRDYIYISFGGNRKGKLRQYLNLLVTMLLGGLWHGASWNFVFWGLLHGVALAIEKIFGLHKARKSILAKLVSWFITMNFIMISWVFFRASTFSDAFLILDRMYLGYAVGINWYYTSLFFIVVLVAVASFLGSKLSENGRDYVYLNLRRFLGLLFFFIVIIGVFVFNPQVVKPFIYFQF